MAFKLVVAHHADKIYKGIDFQQADGMGIIPVRWWFESTRCPSHFHSKYSLYIFIHYQIFLIHIFRQVRENMAVFKLTLFELHNVNLGVKH